MKNTRNAVKDFINKRRANLLILVDDELRRNKNPDFKINSSQQLPTNEEFYVIEKNVYNSNQRDFNYQTNVNSLDLSLSPSSAVNKLEEISSIVASSTKTPSGLEIEPKKQLTNTQILNKSPTLKKKNFLLEITKSKKKNSQCSLAFSKLKVLVNSMKMTKKKSKVLSSKMLIETSKFVKEMNEKQLSTKSKKESLNENNKRKISLISKGKLNVKPSYELITSELNDNFLEKLKFDLKKRKSNEINTPDVMSYDTEKSTEQPTYLYNKSNFHSCKKHTNRTERISFNITYDSNKYQSEVFKNDEMTEQKRLSLNYSTKHSDTSSRNVNVI